MLRRGGWKESFGGIFFCNLIIQVVGELYVLKYLVFCLPGVAPILLFSASAEVHSKDSCAMRSMRYNETKKETKTWGWEKLPEKIRPTLIKRSVPRKRTDEFVQK